MSELLLKTGEIVLVDESDFKFLSQWEWSLGSHGYAFRMIAMKDGNQLTVLMHKQITGIYGPGIEVDHIDGNVLNNKKENLRICNSSENKFNRGPQINNTSGFKGVHFMKQSGYKSRPWQVQIKAFGKRKTIGYFATAEEAALAYNKAAREYHGEFAYQNKVMQNV